MDKEKLKLFQNAILILVGTLVAAIYFIAVQIFPSVQSISDTVSSYNSAVKDLAEKERNYDDLKSSLMEATNMNLSGSTKEMYKPIDSGLDAESIVAGQFDEILEMLRANFIKARAVEYQYNPAQDEFVKGAASKISACHVTLQLVANYKNFENFLRALYKHEHFLDIAKIEILPYEKDKKVLLINLKLLLYANKS